MYLTTYAASDNAESVIGFFKIVVWAVVIGVPALVIIGVLFFIVALLNEEFAKDDAENPKDRIDHTVNGLIKYMERRGNPGLTVGTDDPSEPPCWFDRSEHGAVMKIWPSGEWEYSISYVLWSDGVGDTSGYYRYEPKPGAKQVAHSIEETWKVSTEYGPDGKPVGWGYDAGTYLDAEIINGVSRLMPQTLRAYYQIVDGTEGTNMNAATQAIRRFVRELRREY